MVTFLEKMVIYRCRYLRGVLNQMKKEKLIEQYIENNTLNLEKVMEDYTNYLYVIVKNKKFKLAEEDVEEVISDVFLAVWKNQKQLDIQKEMSSYLAGIANHLYNKKLRNFKNVIDIEDYENQLQDTKNIEQEIEEKQKQDAILQEIYRMKQEDQDIFLCYYYYAKSIKEIAKDLHITESKVKSRLFRIRNKLKKKLEKRGYSYYG